MRTDAAPDRPARHLGANGSHASSDVRALRDGLLQWEGSKPFMYLCTAGYVTTGIGNKLGTAQEAIALPWRHQATGHPATPAEIRTAFERVAAMTSEFRRGDSGVANRFGPDHYEKVSDLVLPQGVVNQLAIDRLTTEFLPGLRELFPGFDAFPQPAQRALVDMVYALGVAGLRTKFPNLVKACRLGNFADAAVESRRAGARAARNAATRDLFQEAERLKASIRPLARELRP